jgi:hypothetical protein
LVQVPVAHIELAGTLVSSGAKPHTPLAQTACWQEPAAAAVQFAADSHCTQTPPEQWPLAQSAPLAHVLPFAHAGQPCCWPQTSAEHAGGGATQTPPVQTPLAQSVAVAQRLPSAHFAHVGPPQSTSVSLPFWTPSLQVGAGGCWSGGGGGCCSGVGCCCWGGALHLPLTQCSPLAQQWPLHTLRGFGQTHWCLPWRFFLQT